MYNNLRPRSFYRRFLHLLSLFKTSLRNQGAQFFQNSTLHGVRYIAESGRPFLERFLWFCCITAGAIATVIIIVDLWDKFQTNPTITGLDTDFHSWDVPFPAITICDIDENDDDNNTKIDDYIANTWQNDDNEQLKREFLKNLTKLNYDSMKSFLKYVVDPDLSSVTDDLKSLVYKVVKHCEDLFNGCKWKGDEFDCCSGFFPIFTENGFCYTFNSRQSEQKWPWQEKLPPAFVLKYIEETDSKWSFEFSSTSGKLLVYIHNSDEVPSIDTNPQHIWDQRVDRLSFSVKQTYTTPDARQLSIKQRHCIYEDEVKLKIDKVMYTFTACTRQCRMKTSKKLCGCIPFFYPLIDDYRYCSLKELSCIINNLDEIKSVDNCNCEIGCSNTVYEVEKLNERTDGEETNLECEFVSWPMVRYKREVLFGWVDLLVSFGGIAGLFLGFSLLSGVEIIYYFTIRACCMVYTNRSEVEKLLQESRLKTKEDDLKYLRGYRQSPGYTSYQRNIWKSPKTDTILRNNKIVPMFPKQLNLAMNDVLEPPFGIQFLN